MRGGQNFAMRLWLDPAQMAARGISASDVAAAIRANNYQSAPGQAKGFFTVTNIAAGTGLVDVDQFNRMVVKSAGRARVRPEHTARGDLGAQGETSSLIPHPQPPRSLASQPPPPATPPTRRAGQRAPR